jgi:hypothetical protein
LRSLHFKNAHKKIQKQMGSITPYGSKVDLI